MLTFTRLPDTMPIVPYEVAKIVSKNVLLVGRCLAHNVEEDIKVRLHRLIFDDYLKMHFRRFADVMVFDPEKLAKDGDVVLIKKLKEPRSLVVRFELSKVLFKFGDITDPISGRKVVGAKYREDMKLVDELFGLSRDSGEPFDYDKAPDRGWQEGRKDWSHKEGYQRWHEFPPGHPLHKDPAAT